MDISNIQGFSAYTANKSATPPVDNTLAQNQNKDAAQTTLNQESAQAAQQAFEVNITPEARDLMAATEEPPAQAAPQAQNTAQSPPQDQSPGQVQNPSPDQNQLQTQNNTGLVNIMA
jgi:hypothetical protein